MEFVVEHFRLAHEPPARPGGPHVLAYCSLLIAGEFVVSGLRLIRHPDNRSFVAMPDKRATVHCPCGTRVARVDRYCRRCGSVLPDVGPVIELGGRTSYYVDLAFPTTDQCRLAIEAAVRREYTRAVVAEYQAERLRRAEMAVI